MISSTLINWSICCLSDTCLDSKIPENSEKCPSQFLRERVVILPVWLTVRKTVNKTKNVQFPVIESE